MAGMSLSHGSLDAFILNANDVVKFKLVREEEDINNEDIEFPPEYTHQFFGERETIFGYIGLSIDIYYTASGLSPLFRMSYEEMVNSSRSGGVEPDDVLKIIVDKLEMTVPSNLDDFGKNLLKESLFKPYGKQIHSFDVVDEDNHTETYQVYQANMLVSGFREYHERMQSFILWFIDAASFIDVDDLRWEYFVLYERVMENGNPRYFFIGYATVYRYYAYPNNLRPRISQMMILPPFQKRGLGAEMLQALYRWYIQDSDVIDVTVEDPSENFVRLRDYVDCKNCTQLTSFQKNNLSLDFCEEMWKEAKEKLKICKKQARRVYEILRLQSINKANKSQYRNYRLCVKRRLNAPYQRQKLDMEKLKKTLSAEEYTATLNCMSRDQRIEQLDKMYKELEAEYEQVAERLSID